MIRRIIGLIQRQIPEGQSLVETALFLPIIILLLAGAVEVSNLLVTQNRVTTASRVGTGFAAANLRGEDWMSLDPLTGWPAQVAAMARNNVTETLDLDPARWDIYTVKARLGRNGNFDTATGGQWNSYHAWGDEQTFSQSAWNGAETKIKQDILAALGSTGTISSAGLELVATVAYHDRTSLLGLNAFNLGAFTLVRGLTVMRVDEPAPYVGCPLVPIAVRYDQFSMYPSNWPTDPVTRYLTHPNGAPVYPQDPASGSQIFPTKMRYPQPALSYVNMATAPVLVPNNFVDNIPGVPLGHARPGFLFLARDSNNKEAPGSFGWLTWDGDASATALRNSTWPPPGNFMEKYRGSPADMNTIQNWDTSQLGRSGDGDGLLKPTEWVEASTGNIVTAEDELKMYLNGKLPATLIVYDRYTGQGNNGAFRVSGFVKVNVLGYELGTDDKWVLFEFIGWAEACS